MDTTQKDLLENCLKEKTDSKKLNIKLAALFAGTCIGGLTATVVGGIEARSMKNIVGLIICGFSSAMGLAISAFCTKMMVGTIKDYKADKHSISIINDRIARMIDDSPKIRTM